MEIFFTLVSVIDNCFMSAWFVVDPIRQHSKSFYLYYSQRSSLPETVSVTLVHGLGQTSEDTEVIPG